MIEQARMKEQIQTATGEQLELAYRLVFLLGSEIAGVTASEAEVKAARYQFLQRIFGDSYVDVEGLFRSDS
jgi:hypothetical protein